MLVNFQKEVVDILVAVGHPFQPFDFVVEAFRNGRCDPVQEEVQDVVSQFLPQFHKGRDFRVEGCTDPLSESCLDVFRMLPDRRQKTAGTVTSDSINHG